MRPTLSPSALAATVLGLAALACSTGASTHAAATSDDGPSSGKGNASGGAGTPTDSGTTSSGSVAPGHGTSPASSDGGPSSMTGASSRGGSSTVGGAADGGTTDLDSDIAAIVASISSARVSQTIQALAGFGTRSSCSTQLTGTQGIIPARDWIKAQFETIGGLTTSLEAFAQTGCTQALTQYNVVALLPGRSHPNRIVVIGGHYDSRTVSVTDGTSPAPGANDSGSQTAVVLELARTMVGHSFDATLAFVAFAGEEEGLVGSKALAQNIGALVSDGQIIAMLNCDIVGGDNMTNDASALQQFRLYSPGTPREVGAMTPDGTTDDTSPSRGLMRYVATWASAYVPSMTIIPKLREDRPGRGGDHESFIAAGYPGVRFIEPTENLAHEHTAEDLFQYVTPDYTARVAQIVAAVAASLGRAPSPPASIGGSGNAAGPALTWAAPSAGAVDHFAVAARPATENVYHSRVRVEPAQTSAHLAPAALGIDPASPYFLSVAAVDASGHESLFAYPEYRCDTDSCVVPPGALNITATK